jgi:TolB-like protein
MSAMRAEAGRLDSWKEIASYLRRGARTVQRWEREEGLPVRRLPHEKLGSVYAFKHELDGWFAARGARPEHPTAADSCLSMAVLPFSDLSAAGDQRYLCDGFAEEITLALSRIEGVQTASYRHYDGPKTGVGAVLTGSVRRCGDRLRIAVQLVDARTGFHLWTECFDRTVGDVLDIQDEIAGEVRVALERRMGIPKKTGPCGPVPVNAVQRVPTTSRTPSDFACSRGTREGITA